METYQKMKSGGHVAKSLDQLIRSTGKKYKQESKQWEKLLQKYEHEAQDSDQKLKEVEQSNDGRLHFRLGRQISAPPQWKFECVDVLKELDHNLRKINQLLELRNQARRNRLASVNIDPKDTSSMKLLPTKTGEANLTMMDRTLRTRSGKN